MIGPSCDAPAAIAAAISARTSSGEAAAGKYDSRTRASVSVLLDQILAGRFARKFQRFFALGPLALDYLQDLGVDGVAANVFFETRNLGQYAAQRHHAQLVAALHRGLEIVLNLTLHFSSDADLLCVTAIKPNAAGVAAMPVPQTAIATRNSYLCAGAAPLVSTSCHFGGSTSVHLLPSRR